VKHKHELPEPCSEMSPGRLPSLSPHGALVQVGVSTGCGAVRATGLTPRSPELAPAWEQTEDKQL